MNKSLSIRLAIAGLFAVAGNAFAYDFNADGNTLSIYGILDGSVYVMKQSATPGTGGTSTQSYGWASNNMTTSRLGFTVSRDLGAGLKIGGNLEQELEFASGGSGDGATLSPLASGNGSGQFNRSANIFVSGKEWGEVRLGRQYAPSFSMVAGADALGSNSGGFLYSYVFAANVGNGVLLTNTGPGLVATNVNGGALAPNLYVDGLSYASPVIDNVQVRLFQTFGSNLQPTSLNAGQSFNNNGMTDATVKYSANGLDLGAGYQVVKSGSSSFSKNLAVTGAYTMGDIKVSAGYAKNSYDAATHADNVQIISVGGTYNVTKDDRVGISYTNNKDATNSNNKQNLAALQYDRVLGKNADAYVQFVSSHQSGASLGSLGLSGVYGSTLPGAVTSVNTVFAGARMKF
jgi:predicted porin